MPSSRTAGLLLPLAIAAFAKLAFAAQELSLPEGVSLATPPRAIVDFTLTDQNGKPWRFSQLRGHPALIFFGFAHCADVCPNTLLELRQLQKAAPRELAALRVVMVSVDGERDTPAVLKTYLASFSPRFIGLTGAPPGVAQIAAQFPAVFFKGIPPSPGADYTVQHSPAVYGVDAQGRVRLQFTNAAVVSMINAMRSLQTSRPGA